MANINQERADIFQSESLCDNETQKPNAVGSRRLAGRELLVP